jgi:hypothetical protein
VDSDGDTLFDWEEAIERTDPDDFDTDDDGLSDGAEVDVYGTDPLARDSDGDSLSDGTEVGAGTDPNDRDSVERRHRNRARDRSEQRG